MTRSGTNPESIFMEIHGNCRKISIQGYCNQTNSSPCVIPHIGVDTELDESLTDVGMASQCSPEIHTTLSYQEYTILHTKR